MKLKNNLTNIILAGALALSASGCSKHEKYARYQYSGKIGEEQVTFKEYDFLGCNLEEKDFLMTFTSGCNVLYIKKVKGILVEYSDDNNDLKLDKFEIIKDGKRTIYWDDIIGKKVLEEEQSKYDCYLAKILKLKEQKGLKYLREDLKKEK